MEACGVGDGQEADVEVASAGATAERHLVDVELHRDRVEVERVQPGLLGGLTPRRRREVAVTRLDVTAELEPRPRLRVQGQQHLAAVG